MGAFMAAISSSLSSTFVSCTRPDASTLTWLASNFLIHRPPNLLICAVAMEENIVWVSGRWVSDGPSASVAAVEIVARFLAATLLVSFPSCAVGRGSWSQRARPRRRGGRRCGRAKQSGAARPAPHWSR